MAQMKTKQELLTYFEAKSKRGEHKQGAFYDAVNEVLLLLEEVDDIGEIKSQVRRLHREKLREIQEIADIEERIEQRKKLAVYDDCLTRMRTIHA